MSKSEGAEGKVRETRRKYSAEEKIRIVLEGLRGEESTAALCRREGIAPNLYYSWSKEFLEAGKRRLMGDTKRQATSGEVRSLRLENSQLKELVADLSLKNVMLKKAWLVRATIWISDAFYSSREDGNHPAGGGVIPAGEADAT
ncbi:MAG: transposase [Desulfarculaceae bacterium]|nr:transposase [Desulfarculaceae bacterium]